MKKIKYFTFICIFLLSCKLLPVNEIIKGIYKMKDKDFYFKIVEIRSGATSQDITMIRRVYSDSTYEVACVVDRIGDLKEFSIEKDTATIILKYLEWHDSIYYDTSRFHINRCISHCK